LSPAGQDRPLFLRAAFFFFGDGADAQKLEHRPSAVSSILFSKSVSTPPGRLIGPTAFRPLLLFNHYCFSTTNFGNTGVPGKPDFGLLGWKTGVPGKPDFGLLGWKSGDFGNLKEAMTVERSRPRLRGLVFSITR
jgi:hypothetical protein